MILKQAMSKVVPFFQQENDWKECPGDKFGSAGLRLGACARESLLCAGWAAIEALALDTRSSLQKRGADGLRLLPSRDQSKCS